ncbi:hypothetical protein KY290_003654 [Solanum tuberosum]|uniref:Leucine-rich repeat-containing N-terminal plant-type domain-containing protein n=1 Tax=Solanum tuberosum TaxID=4113 RepID=A0ABQ7WTJ2_SOLTU|nr:hypothetical protein KY290_003654 [Solanum tuberosum]
MFTINPNAFDYCYDVTGQETQSYPRTLSWKKSTDCCSWDGVHCDETTGQVIELDLRCSQLQGKFHSNSSLFQLSNLKRLDLSLNDFSGSLISPKFGEFSSLTHLYLLGSSFTGLIPSEISHLSKIHVLHISGLNELRLGPHNFELLLKNLTQLRELNLNFLNISSTFPSNFSFHLTTLQLQSTQLHGVLPERVFHLLDLESLQLSYNPQLTVRFPMTKWNSTASLMYLRLYDVNITDRIPESFSHLTSLLVLDMSDCNLSGSITKPLWNLTNIEFLDLGNNHLKGPISQFSRFGNLRFFVQFPNWSNSIQRKWTAKPAITRLVIKLLERDYTFLDILPSFTRSSYIKTKSAGRTDNLFAQIRVIDLSSNGFSGDLPVSLFQNFQAMKTIGENSGTSEYLADTYSDYYTNSLIVTTKGLDHELRRILTTQIIIDLSRNRFEGHISSIIGDLIGLRTLNLSHNVLEGHIPASFQNLSVLESLDLSSNKISGAIPPQLASLTFLAVLNLSQNHLVGCIPKGKQFDTFENSSYQGNDGLRGLPPSRDCGRDDRVPQETIPVELDQEEEEEDSPMISWQAVLMGYGCGLVIGLSVIYIMLSTQYPTWFWRMVVELEHRITTRMKMPKKRY